MQQLTACHDHQALLAAPMPKKNQPLALALAFNRSATGTDSMRIKQLERCVGCFVVSVAHNAEASGLYDDQRVFHHLNANFGSGRFYDSLAQHFRVNGQAFSRVNLLSLE